MVYVFLFEVTIDDLTLCCVNVIAISKFLSAAAPHTFLALKFCEYYTGTKQKNVRIFVINKHI